MTPHDKRTYGADMNDMLTDKYRPANARYLMAIRLVRGYSQSQIGKVLGTHKMKISRLESGETPITAEDRIKLAEFFKVDPDKFLSGP